jgi:biopolymer transport protein ExbB
MILELLAQAAAPPAAADRLRLWLSEGGIFLWLILACGAVSLLVILSRVTWMRRSQMLPGPLVRELEKLENDPAAIDRVRVLLRGPAEKSPLGKVTRVALTGASGNLPDLEGAVEARARREVTNMQWGLSVLDVVITIAPLLGLLGTAAGLVDVFGGIGGAERDMSVVALGVGKALSTTIAGLAVAVPSVIAHSVFTSAIERGAVEMEVLMHRLVGRLVQAARGY